MSRIKNEMIKSIRFIIPIVLIFTISNFNNITNTIDKNISIILAILAPFIIGFVIAYILNRPMMALEEKLKLSRGGSIAVIYGIVICIIIFSWLFIAPTIALNINDLYRSIPHGIGQVENFIYNISSQIDISNEKVNIQINKFITTVLLPLSATLASVTGDFIIKFMNAVVSYTVNMFLGIVISIYLLLSKEKYLEVVNIISKKILRKHYNNVKEVVNMLDNNIGVYVLAKGIDSLIYGIICTLILYIIKSEYALLVGIIIGITNMIPFFGPIIGTIVAFVINLFFSFDKSIIVLVAMVIAQQLESAILEPYFVGKQVGVPPIFTILAVTLAGKFFGFWGILLSVPVTGVLLIYANRLIYRDYE